MNRFKFFASVFAFALLLLTLPAASSAQYRSRDDDYSRNNRGNNNYNRRYLVDAVRRVEDASRTFRRALDRDLDRSRYDTTNREDRVNDIAERFATAADDLEDSFDDGRNINSSQDEARLMFDLAAQIDRFVARNQFSRNTETQWNSIRRDLNTIADAYGYRSYNNRRNNDDYYDNDRNNRRDNRRDNRRNNRNGNRGRFPF